MKCLQCDCEYAAELASCPRCAAPGGVTCPGCGFQAPATFAFCPMCATSLTAPEEWPRAPLLDDAIQRLVPKAFAERLLASRGQVQPERRTVTILFSDVRGSTSMAEHLDPEDVMEIMDGAFNVLIEPVYRYEGTLARLMGDAILAFFGAPIAHEDDPERAVRAALDIIEGAQRYAALLEEDRGIKDFNVRAVSYTHLTLPTN